MSEMKSGRFIKWFEMRLSKKKIYIYITKS